MKRRIPSPFNLDLRRSFFQSPHILRRQLYGCSAKVLFETRELRRAGDGNNPRLLRQQPCKRDLRGRGLLLCCKFSNHIHQGLVGLAIVLTESRYRVAEVGAVEFRLGVDLPRQETLSKRTERNETNAEFLKRRHHRLFRFPPEQRVFTLKSG